MMWNRKASNFIQVIFSSTSRFFINFDIFEVLSRKNPCLLSNLYFDIYIYDNILVDIHGNHLYLKLYLNMSRFLIDYMFLKNYYRINLNTNSPCISKTYRSKHNVCYMTGHIRFLICLVLSKTIIFLKNLNFIYSVNSNFWFLCIFGLLCDYWFKLRLIQI